MGDAGPGVDEAGDMVGVYLFGAIDLHEVVDGGDLGLAVEDLLFQSFEDWCELEGAVVMYREGVGQAEARDQMQLAGEVGHGDAERFVDAELAAQEFVFVVLGKEAEGGARLDDLDAEPWLIDDAASEQQLGDGAFAAAAGAP